jgi:uncharacterized protein YsxB (DUF464 family)
LLTVAVHLSEDGCLSGFEAAGHAGQAPAGQNIACAAATVLLRTTVRVLLSTPGLSVDDGADAPGNMVVRILSRGVVDAGRLSGITDFLLRGLSDLAEEFPREIAVVIA